MGKFLNTGFRASFPFSLIDFRRDGLIPKVDISALALVMQE
jgi:hypothetical protein